MKVLVVGCSGQVGTELMALVHTFDVQAIGFDHNGLDITDESAVQACVSEHEPDVLINAAAYTAVDKAEEDKDAAFAVNATAVGYLAKACAKQNIPLVHISTDYVFDGSKQGAYTEEDVVSPLGVYGESKLAGEEAVREFCDKFYIFRTSWVFSAHGNNFVKTMLRLAAKREELGVVADQLGKPTSAKGIASIVYKVLTSDKQAWGTYHLAQPEVISWHGFAQGVFDEAKHQGVSLKIQKLNAIATKNYPTPTSRPANSVLDCTKLEKTFDLELKPWRESLTEVIKDLRHE